MAEKFVLIGSGLAGGLLAAYFGRRGYEVDLYERRADPRAGNFVGGRSINLALSTRGIHALQQLGIADEVLRYAIPMRGRMIHDRSGDLHFSPYDRDPNKCINSIGRAALNTTVIEAAQRYPNVRVHFNSKCTDVDLDSAIDARTRAGEDSPDLDNARSTFRALIARLGEAVGGGPPSRQAAIDPFVATLLELRNRARAARDWELADLIRDRLAGAGVAVSDNPESSTWTLS